MIKSQEITKHFAIYNGDCVEGMAQLPDNSIHFTCYSPPFCGLYNYSSDDKDMSNCASYGQFFEHYEWLVKEKTRVTMPGRLTAVHCMDVPGKNGSIVDFPGDIIRLHERLGWQYQARYCIWKEPLRVAIRTRSKALTHRQIVKDSTECSNAGGDYVLTFRKKGDNPVPVAHPVGLTEYAGEREIPPELVAKFRDWENPQTNKMAHWIWQQYASCFWDDIRVSKVLKYKSARDPDDEKHCHPLQLDVIHRLLQLYTNPGERVLTPFMGVGSEVFEAVRLGRFGIGFELKESYFRQAKKNLLDALSGNPDDALLPLEFEPETEEPT